MEKIQLLERSSGSLQRTAQLSGHGLTHYPRHNANTRLSYSSCSTEYIQSDTCPCLPNSSCLMPLVLSVGILLTVWCSPPHPNLPANSRPGCHRQETDFCLRAGRVSEESTGSSAGAQASSKTQPVTNAVSHCPGGLRYAAELRIKAARDCLGAEQGHSRGHGRPLRAVLPQDSSNFRGTLSPHLQYHT